MRPTEMLRIDKAGPRRRLVNPCDDEHMAVTPEEAERLLEKVREATLTAKRSREAANRDSTLRRETIEAAMSAGIPREDIASAAGVHRNVLYQILKQESRSK